MTGAAVVLAAGRSSRMGSPKAELAYAGGTFLSTILERLPHDLLGFLAVVAREPVDGVNTLINEHPERGQLSSLVVGLRGGAAKFGWTLAVLVDQPGVSAATYRRLAEAAQRQPGDLWVPAYQGKRGHPVVWGQACYPDLLQAPDGRWVVARHRDRRVEVAVEDPEVLRDVDTPEDYRRLLEDDASEDHRA